MGERTQANFFDTGTNSRHIPKRPLLFHERSLACVQTGHSRVVGTVKCLSFEVFAMLALGERTQANFFGTGWGRIPVISPNAHLFSTSAPLPAYGLDIQYLRFEVFAIGAFTGSAHGPISLARGQIPVISPNAHFFFTSAPLPAYRLGTHKWWALLNILVWKCLQLAHLGELTRATFFGTGINSRSIPERPLIFHERSLACIRTGHS